MDDSDDVDGERGFGMLADDEGFAAAAGRTRDDLEDAFAERGERPLSEETLEDDAVSREQIERGETVPLEEAGDRTGEDG